MGMELNTKRLRIIPLDLTQFQLLLDGTDQMEQALHLNASNERLEEHTQQAMQGLYQEALKHRENYLWYTNWQIILNVENISIGSACFMGNPNENGEVEFGYGINENYRNNGYMTEAATAIYQWALKQPGVFSVIAETEKENTASHKVLQKCGMVQYKETADSYFWHIENCDSSGVE